MKGLSRLEYLGIFGLILIGGIGVLSFTGINLANIAGSNSNSSLHSGAWYGISPVSSYPSRRGESENKLQVGTLKISNLEPFTTGDSAYREAGCSENPKVSLNGQTIDNWNNQNYIARYYKGSGANAGSVKKTYKLGDGTTVTVDYLSTFNFKPIVYHGVYYGGHCKGVFDSVNVQFPTNELYTSINHKTTNSTNKILTGTNPGINIKVENSWTNSVELNGTATICKPTPSKCDRKHIEQKLNTGTNNIQIHTIAQQKGTYRVKFHGDIRLNTNTYPIKGIDVKKNGKFEKISNAENYLNIKSVTKTLSYTVYSRKDTDGDGVLNFNDKCPNAYGTKANGCPTILDSVVNFFNQFIQIRS